MLLCALAFGALACWLALGFNTLYCDLVNGNDANNGTSFAQRVKTINHGTSLMAPGDTLRVMGSPPTPLGQLSTWNGLNPATPVVLTSPVTQTIADCQSNWTLSANVSGGSESSFVKFGTVGQQIAIQAGFTTGLAAFFATGALNLSGYQQVTFWLVQESGNPLIAGNMSLRLCSDSNGVTTVNTIPLPALSSSSGVFYPVTVDLGTALGSNINSIALYVDTNNGAQTIDLCLILAALPSSQPNSLTLTSLIGHQDSTGAGGLNWDSWYGIGSISGTTVTLDKGGALASSQLGWADRAVRIQSSTNTSPISINAPSHGLQTGDTIVIPAHPINTNAQGTWTVTVTDANNFTLNGSVGNGVGPAAGGFYATSKVGRATWKRETLKMPSQSGNTTPTNDLQSIGASGTAANPLIISGGWDSASMTSQVGETWIDGQNAQGIGLDFLATNYVNVSQISACRCGFGIVMGGAATPNTGLVYSASGATCCGNTGVAYFPVGFANSGISNSQITVTAVSNCGQNHFLMACLAGNTINIGLLTNTRRAGGPIASILTPSGLIVNLGTMANCAQNAITVSAVGGLVEFNCNGIYNIGTGGLVAGPLTRNNIGFLSNMGGITVSNESIVSACTANNPAGFNFTTTIAGRTRLVNCYSTEATKFSLSTGGTRSGAYIVSFNDQFSGNTVFYAQGASSTTPLAIVTTDSTTVHTPGGKSWKVSVLDVTFSNSATPIELTLARLTVVAGTTYTISCWTRRDSTATLTSRLKIYGGQSLGVPNDLVSPNSAAAANAWELLTLPAFTPTQSVIEITGQVWDGTGTTSNAWFDDLQVGDGTHLRTITLDYTDPRFGPAADPLSGPFTPIGFQAGNFDTWSKSGDSVTKLPEESKLCNFDFTNFPQILAGLTIVSAVINIQSPLGAQAVTATGLTISSPKVQARFAGGSPLNTYAVDCDATLSDGSVIGIAGRMPVGSD